MVVALGGKGVVSRLREFLGIGAGENGHLERCRLNGNLTRFAPLNVRNFVAQ